MQKATRAIGIGIFFSGFCLSAFIVSLCPGESPAPRPLYGRGPVPRALPTKGGSYYYELAEVHKRYGVYDKALEMLEIAVERETDSTRKTRYYESLSQIYRIKGDPKEAAAQMRKALTAAQTLQEKCRCSTVLGRICEEAGNLQCAKAAYQFVISNATIETQKRSAQANLFRLYQRAGQIEKVIADLEKKLKDNPDDEETLDTLAQIFSSLLRQPSRALPIYERLSKLKPGDTGILSRLVYLYQSNKEFDKAAAVYQRIIEASPSQSRGYYYQQLSRMYMLAGKKDEAVKWAEKVISQNSVRPYTYVPIARIYLQNNLPEKAVELYDRALAACRRPIESHPISLRFADLFAQNKMEDKAEQIYKRVLKEAATASFKSQARSKLIALYRSQGKTAEIEALKVEEPSKTLPPR